MEEKGKARYMNIKVETESGKVLDIVDEHGNKPEKVDPDTLEKITRSDNGFKHIGLLLHSHSSPGCVYYVSGGWAYRICS